MSWFTRLFTPEPPPLIGAFVQGVIESTQSDLQSWVREGRAFRHVPTSMTMEVVDVGEDDICLVCRLTPHQDINWSESRALVQACSELDTAIGVREADETARQAALVRAVFESRHFPS